jgi:hypothetical protein
MCRSCEMQKGSLNTMAYRYDTLRVQLFDSEGDERIVCDSQGTSGYQDLLHERLL